MLKMNRIIFARTLGNSSLQPQNPLREQWQRNHFSRFLPSPQCRHVAAWWPGSAAAKDSKSLLEEFYQCCWCVRGRAPCLIAGGKIHSFISFLTEHIASSGW